MALVPLFRRPERFGLSIRPRTAPADAAVPPEAPSPAPHANPAANPEPPAPVPQPGPRQRSPRDQGYPEDVARRRKFSDALEFWKTCDLPCCIRAKACRGDLDCISVNHHVVQAMLPLINALAEKFEAQDAQELAAQEREAASRPAAEAKPPRPRRRRSKAPARGRADAS